VRPGLHLLAHKSVDHRSHKSRRIGQETVHRSCFETNFRSPRIPRQLEIIVHASDRLRDQAYSYLNDVLKEQLPNVVVRQLLVELIELFIALRNQIRPPQHPRLYPELDCCGAAVIVYDEVKATLDDGTPCDLAV
jgi:hypothetical protein